MSEQDRIAFDKWLVREKLSGYDIEARMLKSWQAATAEANKRIKELENEVARLNFISSTLKANIDEHQAHINDLREALQEAIGYIPAYTVNESVVSKWRSALKATPAESLQAHDAETIKRYADDLDNNHWVFIPHDLRKPLKEVK